MIIKRWPSRVQRSHTAKSRSPVGVLGRLAAGYYTMLYDGLRHWHATEFLFWKAVLLQHPDSVDWVKQRESGSDANPCREYRRRLTHSGPQSPSAGVRVAQRARPTCLRQPRAASPLLRRSQDATARSRETRTASPARTNPPAPHAGSAYPSKSIPVKEQATGF